MSTKIHRMLEELEQAAEQLDIDVSYEKMTGLCSGRGGLCTVKGKHRVIVDRKSTPQERLDALLEALCRFDLDGLYLSPRTREAVERCKEEGARAARKAAGRRPKRS
jgi:hypothetical protein